MNEVVLRHLSHGGIDCIGIFFEINFKIQGALRRLGAKFSKSNKCWYIERSQSNYTAICVALKELATIRTIEDPYPEPGKKLQDDLRERSVAKNLVSPISTISRLPNKALEKPKKISKVNEHVLPRMKERLQLKAYSPSTIRTYLNEMAQLLYTLNEIPADNLGPEHLRRYMVYCYEKLRLTENTLHSRINALKFYYEQVLNKEKFFWEIPRPKKQLQLPSFFNRDEIAAIIKAAGNIKHKTMLMLAYAAGLRVSEVVNIRVRDIDSQRMCILVRQSKGKKDRMVVLSPVLLVMLREYYKTMKVPVDGYLFPGQEKDHPYSSRSLQLVLAEAKKKAGILKPGSVHALRHSFATHLLDKGTDVTMIMKLLGHNDLKTTLRYLHVTNRDILEIISPLDDLNL